MGLVENLGSLIRKPQDPERARIVEEFRKAAPEWEKFLEDHGQIEYDRYFLGFRDSKKIMATSGVEAVLLKVDFLRFNLIRTIDLTDKDSGQFLRISKGEIEIAKQEETRLWSRPPIAGDYERYSDLMKRLRV